MICFIDIDIAIGIIVVVDDTFVMILFPMISVVDFVVDVDDDDSCSHWIAVIYGPDSRPKNLGFEQFLCSSSLR